MPIIALLGTVLAALGRFLVWAIQFAPIIMVIINIIVAFWQPAQQWVSDLASNTLPMFGIDRASMSILPTSYLTQVNTFAPLDTIVASFTLYIPFLLACLAQRIARATLFHRR